MHLHHKLENALASWLIANRGDRFAGVEIVPAHATTEPPLPYLGVWCERAQPHPDFPGFGKGYPRVCTVVFEFRTCAEDEASEEESAGAVDHETGQVHAATIAGWLEDLHTLLAGESGDYQVIRDALNIPIEGPDTRYITQLYITAIHLGDVSSSMNGVQWGEVLALEIIAQDSDPAP